MRLLRNLKINRCWTYLTASKLPSGAKQDWGDRIGGIKVNYVGFAVLMAVVAAAFFGYLRTCDQNRSEAGAGLVWQLVPTSGKATYDAELAQLRRENFDEEYRTYGAVFGGAEKTFPYGQTVSLAEIVGSYGCDSQSVKGWMTSFYRWGAGGIGYLLVDVTYNIAGNNQPHRFLAFREVGIFAVEGYQKVLDYRWNDGWSHPAWYFTEEGLYIASWVGELDGQRTYQRTHRVEVDGCPLRERADAELDILRRHMTYDDPDKGGPWETDQ